MKTLDQFKDEIARSKGFKDWNTLYTAGGIEYNNKMFNEAAELYTLQEVKKHLAIAAEKAFCDCNTNNLLGLNKEYITSIKIELT